MGFNRNQIDDFDDFNEFEDKLTLAEGPEGEPAPHNSPLAWRRPLIEKALLNVRRAFEAKIDLKANYNKGELLFDKDAQKYGRVVDSRPGFLNVSFVSGGKALKQDINPVEFVKANRANMTLPELAESLQVSETEVVKLLNQIELKEDLSVPAKVVTLPKASAPQKLSAKDAVVTSKKLVKTKSANTNIKKTVLVHAKPTAKLAAKRAKGGVSKKINPLKDSYSFAKLLPKGTVTDPIADPNGYVQQNFLLLNNKELALATGLSEHTIRRKLGEWGLKRKDYVNRA